MVDAAPKPPVAPKAAQIAAGLKPGRFHVGLKPGSGRTSVTFGGITFPLVTYGGRKSNGETVYDQERQGDELDLDAEALARINEWCGRKVVRVVDEDSGKTLLLS